MVWKDVDAQREPWVAANALFPAVPTRAPAARSAAGRVQLSRYQATTCLTGSMGRGGGTFRAHQRKMISNRRLAQDDKRKSEDDGRRDDGAELGKYRPESARSELQRFAPCSPTKIVHVGLHVWRRPAGQPAAARA